MGPDQEATLLIQSDGNLGGDVLRRGLRSLGLDLQERPVPLTFTDNPPQVQDCHRNPARPEQGFAIEWDNWQKGHRRPKRSDAAAARLTAGQIHSYKNLKAVVKSLNRMVCQRLRSAMSL